MFEKGDKACNPEKITRHKRRGGWETIGDKESRHPQRSPGCRQSTYFFPGIEELARGLKTALDGRDVMDTCFSMSRNSCPEPLKDFRILSHCSSTAFC